MFNADTIFNIHRFLSDYKNHLSSRNTRIVVQLLVLQVFYVGVSAAIIIETDEKQSKKCLKETCRKPASRVISLMKVRTRRGIMFRQSQALNQLLQIRSAHSRIRQTLHLLLGHPPIFQHYPPCQVYTVAGSRKEVKCMAARSP